MGQRPNPPHPQEIRQVILRADKEIELISKSDKERE